MTTSHLASQRCWLTSTLRRFAHPAPVMRCRGPAGTSPSLGLSSCTLRSALLHRAVAALAGNQHTCQEILHMLMRDHMSYMRSMVSRYLLLMGL
jgi:hypothetical protein